SMGVEGLNRLHAPGLTLLTLGLGPGDRLPIGPQDQACACIRHLDAVSGRLVNIEEKGALDRVLVRARLDMDAVFQKDIRCAQDILTAVDSVSDVVEATGYAVVIFGIGDIIALVVDGEPAAAQPSIVELDLLRHTTSKSLGHEVADGRDILRQQVQMVDPAHTNTASVIALGDILESGTFGLGRHVERRVEIEFENVTIRI